MTASINTEPFVLSSVGISGEQYNVYMDSAGGDRNAIHSNGRAGFYIGVRGYVLTQSEYETVQAEFMKSGEQDLILRTGGHTYKVFSIEFTPLHDLDTEVMKYPFAVRLLTENTDIDLGMV